MSEKLEACPVCGKNDWRSLDWLSALPDSAYCTGCGTIIPINHIDDRVMQWVPVAERLPDKDGYYIVKKAVTHSLKYDTCKFKDGKWFLCWEGCETRSARAVTHWLDDHTFDKEKS